jgi:bifunctional UDP-N-acetylglucosamine pyrophosphorylase/glucosamine-1-phosphate N-acetyltransferase
VIERVYGVPIIVRVLQAVEKAGITETMVVVNPRDQDLIQRVVYNGMRDARLLNLPRFVLQPDRYGSADAVYRAIPALQERGVEQALITYGDMPLWSTETIRALVRQSEAIRRVATMVTVPRHADFPTLDRYGRVVRDSSGTIERIIEVNDPAITTIELEIERVNPSLWVWDLAWLRSNIPAIIPTKKTDGHPDERHMPPLIARASAHGLGIGELQGTYVLSSEALGVNSQAELDAL